ncbi:MAG TPA: diguanylate cyclase [Usitatibacter sp.]|nr:diguanylate cyclase [Usitatibacter sp.]
MHLYATDSALAPLEEGLESARGAERLAVLAPLAWHLRQRDTRRADRLAVEALAVLEASDPRNTRMRARITLTRAECALLLARLDDATALASEAAHHFQAADDDAGVGDCALVHARLAEARGERDRELPRYGEAIAAYAQAKDMERLAHARAASLLAQSFGDPATLAAGLASLREAQPERSEAVQAHHQLIEGFIVFQRGQFLDAVPELAAAAALGPECGLVDQAFRAESGLVSAHSNLGDREASCVLAEKVLSKARALGWPRAIGHALANFGRQLSDTGQPERAIELFLEALDVLGDQPRSRSYAIACYYLGDSLLALGRHAEALVRLEHAEGCMRDLGAQPEVACLLAIEATALARLGRAEEALARGEESLALARKTRSRLWEVEALRALAEIHASHRLAPSGYAGPNSGLRLLDEALGVVEAIGGHHEKSELYTEIARAHETTGEMQNALRAERAARREERTEQNRRAANQLLLARERNETERQRAEAEWQRSIAHAESERARTLEAALDTLEQLRLVGQDITAHLDPGAMLEAIDRHLRSLADVSFIGAYVFHAEGNTLTRHAIERGRSLPVRDIALEDLESYGARAARERQEIYVEADEGGAPGARIPGTDVKRTLWFGPLLLHEELLGVLTVQSSTPSAYSEREKLVFRTLCGYVAVAFANARTHGELEEKHRQLLKTEADMRRLATTDPLTGLANRRHYLTLAENELLRAKRYGGAVGIIMADLDRFKQVNDRCGHGAGDALIAAVGEELRLQQRPHDVIARMGGEEFALMLPGADLEACVAAAERIREAIEQVSIEYLGQRVRATMSLGCSAVADARGASEEAPAEILARLLREADASLYEAKRLGRNRVHASVPGARDAVN